MKLLLDYDEYDWIINSAWLKEQGLLFREGWDWKLTDKDLITYPNLSGIPGAETTLGSRDKVLDGGAHWKYK